MSNPGLKPSLGRASEFIVTMYWNPAGFGALGPELKGLGDLALIDAIEEVAVVQQETGTAALLQADLGEHQVEAEDLHIGDALAPLAVDMDVELRAAAGLGDGEAAGLLVKRFRQGLEGQNCLAKDRVALVEIVAQRLGQVGALDVELRLGALDALGGFEPLAETFDLSLGAAGLLAQVGVMLQRATRAEHTHDLAPASVALGGALVAFDDPRFSGRDLGTQMGAAVFDDRAVETFDFVEAPADHVREDHASFSIELGNVAEIRARPLRRETREAAGAGRRP